MKDHGGTGRVTDRGPDHGQAAALVLNRIDAAGVEPPLDESGRLVDTVLAGSVVGDQALREGEQIGDCLLTLCDRDKGFDPFEVALGDRAGGVAGLGVVEALPGA